MCTAQNVFQNVSAQKFPTAFYFFLRVNFQTMFVHERILFYLFHVNIITQPSRQNDALYRYILTSETRLCYQDLVTKMHLGNKCTIGYN